MRKVNLILDKTIVNFLLNKADQKIIGSPLIEWQKSLKKAMNEQAKKDKIKLTGKNLDYCKAISALDLIQQQNQLTELKSKMTQWLSSKYQGIKHIRLASHPEKMIHPDAKLKNGAGSDVSINYRGDYQANGYLHSRSVDNIAQDFSGSASFLPLTKLLWLALADGQLFCQHIKDDTAYGREQLDLQQIDYDDLRQQLLAFDDKPWPNQTSKLIKQVYFPTANDEQYDYHLLSILQPSGVMSKLKEAIRTLKFRQDDTIHKARKDNKPPPEGEQSDYATLSKVAIINYGGSQPQNISQLNSNMGGQFYLLLSLPPPQLKQPYRTTPKKDFFSSVYLKEFQSSSASLAKLFNRSHDNERTRQKLDKLLLFAFDCIIDEVFSWRSFEPGWSQHSDCKLPRYQQVILDNHWQQVRVDEPQYMNRFIEESVRWLSEKYGKDFKGDALLEYIKKLIDKKRRGVLQ